MRGDLLQQIAGVGIPQTHHACAVARRQQRAIRRISQADRPAGMAFHVQQLLPIRQVPGAQAVIIRDAGQSLAVWRKGRCRDRILVPFQGQRQRAAAFRAAVFIHAVQRPDLDSRFPGGGSGVFAIRRQADMVDPVGVFDHIQQVHRLGVVQVQAQRRGYCQQTVIPRDCHGIQRAAAPARQLAELFDVVRADGDAGISISLPQVPALLGSRRRVGLRLRGGWRG